MSRKYESGSDLQQKILKGIDVLADNVASTLGPRGRNVILFQKGDGQRMGLLLLSLLNLMIRSKMLGYKY